MLADFLVVVNLLLDDYGSADFSNFYICYVVNVQGITRHLRLKLNTNAQTVADAVSVAVSWQYTVEVIQERNRLNVLFVANDLHSQVIL